MKGIIILEGPDGSGKTTICEEIERQLCDEGVETEYVHLSWSKTIDPYMDYVNLGAIANALESALERNKVVLIDRCSLSTYIYGGTFRDSSTQANNMFHRTLAMISATRCPVGFIGVLPEYSVWKANYDEMVASREEMYGDDPRMIQIYEEYEKLFRGSPSKANDIFINGIEAGIFNEFDTSFESLAQVGLFDFTKQNKTEYVTRFLTVFNNAQVTPY